MALTEGLYNNITSVSSYNDQKYNKKGRGRTFQEEFGMHCYFVYFSPMQVSEAFDLLSRLITFCGLVLRLSCCYAIATVDRGIRNYFTIDNNHDTKKNLLKYLMSNNSFFLLVILRHHSGINLHPP